jgi:cell division protein FtsI/penicillin-binding protein 2
VNRKRTVILNTIIVFGFFAVVLRLTDLMVFNHRMYAERAKSQQVKSEDIQVRRGNIYDRKGRALAVNLELESLYCDPGEVTIDREGLQRLSRILGIGEKAIQAKFDQDKRFLWVDRKISPDAAGEIKKLNIKGIGFIPEAKRYYPKGELAAHVIGMVGLENQPLEGLELKYDKFLSTAGRKIYFARDASGKKLSSGVELEARGNDLLLTVDEGLQYIAEKELEKAMARWKSVAASAIMMDPFTGEILALANRPGYDLNDVGRAGKNAIRNRAITDIYEPGSTFKVIVGTAALEEKLYNLDSRFDCSRGIIEVGGKGIRDAHRHGVLTFHEVIQKSSNVGSVMLGIKLGRDRIYRYSKLYGFGERTGIDLPGEVSGWIRHPDKWSATSIGAISIGQEVAVTPLQVLRAYAAIANGGFLVRPHLVSEIRTSEGQTVFSSEVEKKRILSENTAALFKDILKTVVEEGGTATQAAVEGDHVAGKTGTAQLTDSRTGRYSKERYISSFVGFVPADNPKIAMIVVIYEPKGQIYGGVVAGPVFKNIADQALSYLNIPMDENFRKDLLLVSK